MKMKMKSFQKKLMYNMFYYKLNTYGSYYLDMLAKSNFNLYRNVGETDKAFRKRLLKEMVGDPFNNIFNLPARKYLICG